MSAPVEFAIAARRQRLQPLGWLLAVAALASCGCNSMTGHVNNQVGMWDYRQGNYVAARVQFYRAVADEPLNASFTYNLACAINHTGDPSGAEQNYRRAIQLDPGYQPAYHGLARLMNEEGRQAESVQLISTWAAAQPRHPGAQIELAWIERQNGDSVASEQALYHARSRSTPATRSPPRNSDSFIRRRVRRSARRPCTSVRSAAIGCSLRCNRGSPRCTPPTDFAPPGPPATAIRRRSGGVPDRRLSDGIARRDRSARIAGRDCRAKRRPGATSRPPFEVRRGAVVDGTHLCYRPQRFESYRSIGSCSCTAF